MTRNKMHRKIIKSGPATLSVSLPASFIKKFELKKGDELEVAEQGDVIKILSSKDNKEELAELDTRKFEELSNRIIGMLYKTGHKSIIVYFDKGKKRTHRGVNDLEINHIRSTIEHLIGMQLWEIGKNDKGSYVLVKESAQLEKEEFDNVKNRLEILLEEQTRTLYEHLTDKDDLSEEIRLNERMINQTSDFCLRILKVHGYKDYKKTLYMYDYIKNIESIADDLIRIQDFYKKNKKFEKESSLCLKNICDFTKRLTSIERKFKIEKLLEINQEIEEAQEHVLNSKQKTVFHVYNNSLLQRLKELIESLIHLNYDTFSK